MIAPTLACANYLTFGTDLKILDSVGVDWFHIDIMDGHYVPNLCLNFEHIKAVQHISDIPLDVHLMVANPFDYLERLASLQVNYVSAHVGALGSQIPVFIEKSKAWGMRVGLVLSPEDDVNVLVPYLDALDYVLVMFVRPGFSGQSLQMELLEKVRTLKAMRTQAGLSFLIQGDGGISWGNIGDVMSAGTDVAVAGALAIFDQKIPLQEAAMAFKSLCV